MRGAAERGHLVIGLGDFNMIPDSLAHRLITTHAPVQDAWRALHPDSSIGAALDAAEKARGRPVPSAGYNLAENGTTCDSAFNTWRWDKRRRRLLDKGEDVTVDDNVTDPHGKRLDYVFIGNGSPIGLQAQQRDTWQVEEVAVGMTERHSTLRCSLSDHFSVEATLSRQYPGAVQGSPSPQLNGSSQILQGHLRSGSGRPSNSSHNPKLLPTSNYEEILAMIASYASRQRRQRRFRLTHFLVQSHITIGCLVAVWWSPTGYVSFILMLVSVFGFTAGVIDGLIGGLFVSSELRALKEFEWEIRNVKARAVYVEEDASGLKAGYVPKR